MPLGRIESFFLLFLVSVMKLGAQAGFHTQGDI